jgi:hypothetical protein
MEATTSEQVEATTPEQIDDTTKGTIKEICVTFERADYAFPFAVMGGKKVKSEILLYNLNKVINPNDISDMDKARGGTCGHELKPLNNLFSDNIVLGCYISRDKIEQNNNALKDLLQRKSEECEDPDDEEECPIKDKLLKEAQPFLAENTEKVKRILTAGGIDITKRDIKPTCVKVINL